LRLWQDRAYSRAGTDWLSEVGVVGVADDVPEELAKTEATGVIEGEPMPFPTGLSRTA